MAPKGLLTLTQAQARSGPGPAQPPRQVGLAGSSTGPYVCKCWLMNKILIGNFWLCICNLHAFLRKMSPNTVQFRQCVMLKRHHHLCPFFFSSPIRAHVNFVNTWFRILLFRKLFFIQYYERHTNMCIKAWRFHV